MTDGISRLIAVTQLKAQNANDDAMHGADKQRDLVGKQRNLREAQRKLDEVSRDKVMSGSDQNAMRNAISSLNGEGINVSYNYSFRGGGEAGDISDTNQKHNADEIDRMRKDLEGAMKDLEAMDRLGNFEIQDLMSQYNQAETLASSVLKKRDDTAGALINKVG